MRVEISSGKLEISKEHFAQRWAQKKDKNGRGLGDAGEVKKRWKEYMEELYKKKDLNDSGNYNYVVSHPELDILECEVKWALGSTAVNRDSGCNGIPVELFKTIKDDAIKMLTFNMLSKSGRPSSSHKTGKGQSSS